MFIINYKIYIYNDHVTTYSFEQQIKEKIHQATVIWEIYSGPGVIIKIFMLNSAEHEFFPAHKC